MTKQALHKIEQFVKVALAEIAELKHQLHTQQVKKAAEREQADKELDNALKKAAQAMYNSDFINDEDEKSLFVKKAREDAKYLAKVVERVCNAADVSYMGKVASVKTVPQTDDPVMRRAFGFSSYDNLLDDWSFANKLNTAQIFSTYMSEEQIKAYIEGFVKQATELGLSKTQAVEAIMKIANDSSVEYPEDQLVEV